MSRPRTVKLGYKVNGKGKKRSPGPDILDLERENP
jgi:hypothetical protein